MKKWIQKILAGVLIAVQLGSLVVPFPSFAAEDTSSTSSETTSQNSVTSLKYVALGDSITAGDNTYVNMVGNYLKNRNGSCTVYNLGVGGLRSGDLLDAMTNSSHPAYQYVRTTIKGADVITLDIGSNDIFVTAYEVFAKCFGCETDQLGAVYESWCARLQSSNWFVRFVAYMQLLPIAQSIHEELYNGETMKDALEDFKSNYNAILQEIDKLAPNAKVYIGNLYNPYNGAPAVYLGSYEVVNLQTFTEKYFCAMNKHIANNSSGKKVVDLYSIFKDDTYLEADYATYNYDPHPNQAGQKEIANKFIAAMQ